MTAIKGLAAAAVLGAAAIAFAPKAASDPLRDTFTVEFRYDAERSTLDNYLAFARQAERACAAQDQRVLTLRDDARACVEDVLNRLSTAMGRAELAALHAERIGRNDDSSRTFAVR